MSDRSLSAAFREAFRCHPAGVAVITAATPKGPLAMTVSSLISVSVEPPTVAFSLSARSSGTRPVLEAGRCVIHMMRFADLELARLAATPGADRFAGQAWVTLPDGTPRYEQVATWFAAEIKGALPVEGATVVVAELTDGACPPPAAADGAEARAPEHDTLIYLDRRWHRLREDPADRHSFTFLPAEDPDLFH